MGKLSIILPVYNEAESLKMMVPIVEATLEAEHEILVVYDFPEDTSVISLEWLKTRYSNVRGVLNDQGKGVANALKKGILAAEGDVVVIMLVDEVFPIARISDMLELINKGCDFVSCTRYSLGGKRLGGSLIGGCLSRVANMAFRVASSSALTDATTGVKMFRKSVFDKINIEANTGWAFAFEFSIKAQLLGLKIGEIPIISIDRLFGGDSTFKVGAWIREYMKWFIWGAKKLNKFKTKRAEVITLDKYRKK